MNNFRIPHSELGPIVKVYNNRKVISKLVVFAGFIARGEIKGSAINSNNVVETTEPISEGAYFFYCLSNTIG